MTKVILFLNCFLRYPNWFFSDNQIRRIPRIVKAMLYHRPHIIGFAEIFGKVNINKMMYLFSQNEYKFIFPNNGLNTGLAIAVCPIYEIISSTFIPFTHSIFPDSLADKGFFIANIRHKDSHRSSIIITTHLQAKYPHWTDTSLGKRITNIQIQQLFQIFTYVSRFHENMEYIICGDFNINVHKNTRDARIFAQLFPSALQITQDTTFNNEILDYIISSKHCTVQPIHGFTGELSDHKMIKAIF